MSEAAAKRVKIAKTAGHGLARKSAAAANIAITAKMETAARSLIC